MKHVLTLIAPRDKEKLTEEHITTATGALADKGGHVFDKRWLSQGEACDIFFTTLPVEDADKAVQERIQGLAVDAIVHPAGLDCLERPVVGA